MPHQPYREAHVEHDEPRRGRELVVISDESRTIEYHYYAGLTIEDLKELASEARNAALWEAAQRLGVEPRPVSAARERAALPSHRTRWQQRP